MRRQRKGEQLGIRLKDGPLPKPPVGVTVEQIKAAFSQMVANGQAEEILGDDGKVYWALRPVN
jgi:hypothetical protein